jgi:hypothetical protein
LRRGDDAVFEVRERPGIAEFWGFGRFWRFWRFPPTILLSRRPCFAS